jgi:hypothetical protein
MSCTRDLYYRLMFSKSTYVAEFTQCRATLSHTNGACHIDIGMGLLSSNGASVCNPPSIESDCGHGPALDYEIHAISYASYASITSSEPRNLVATFFCVSTFQCNTLYRTDCRHNGGADTSGWVIVGISLVWTYGTV